MGNGKFSGMLGSFQVKLLSKPTVKFGVSGMPLSIRQNYKTSHLIGTIITVCYTELTKTGKPRFPRYKGIRHDVIDLHNDTKPKIKIKPKFTPIKAIISSDDIKSQISVSKPHFKIKIKSKHICPEN